MGGPGTKLGQTKPARKRGDQNRRKGESKRRNDGLLGENLRGGERDKEAFVKRRGPRGRGLANKGKEQQKITGDGDGRGPAGLGQQKEKRLNNRWIKTLARERYRRFGRKNGNKEVSRGQAWGGGLTFQKRKKRVPHRASGVRGDAAAGSHGLGVASFLGVPKHSFCKGKVSSQDTAKSGKTGGGNAKKVGKKSIRSLWTPLKRKGG